MGDFVSDMFISLDYNRAACIDKFEFFTVIAGTTGMNRSDAKFPSEIIFEPDKSHTNKGVEKDIEGI